MTFEQLCPEWSGKFIRGDWSKLGDGKYCAVGEAYGYTDEYSKQWYNKEGKLEYGSKFCHECYVFSVKMYSVSQLESHKATPKEKIQMNQELSKEFTEHWNQKHSGMTWK